MKVGILPNDDDSCGGYHSLPPPPPATPLAGEHGFDHVVLGAGFAGLAAARQLALHYPDREVALVDVQRVGYGASSEMLSHLLSLPRPARNLPQPLLGLGVRAKIAWDQVRAGRER